MPPPSRATKGVERSGGSRSRSPGAELAAAVVNKAVIVNVRATAHDHLRNHPCHPLTVDRGGPKKRRITVTSPLPRRRNGSSRGQESRHSQRESDRPRSPSRSPLLPPSRSTKGVRRRGGSRSRSPRRRNGSSRGGQSRHSQRESDRPRSPSQSPLPPPSRSTEGSEEEEDYGHVPPGAEMAAAVGNKAVIVNVRATAHDHLRDHPCHPPHGRQREQEGDHVQARLSPTDTIFPSVTFCIVCHPCCWAEW